MFQDPGSRQPPGSRQERLKLQQAKIFRSAPSFLFTQNTAVTTWNINHNLEKNPSVSITSFGGTVAEAKVDYIDKNNLTITFNAAFSGKAYLN